MAESQSESAPMAEEEEEDSQWEYEYHETETESFYVTLDISSAIDYGNLGPRKKKPDLSPRKVLQPTTSPGTQDNAALSEPPEPQVPETTAPMDIDQTLEQPEEDTSSSMHKDRLQILDLHTQNPLISFQNQLYSCEWTSTLGTDVLLTAPAPEFPHPVLREKPNVSILATSSIKLMGRPAEISSRHYAEEGIQTSSTPAPDSSTASTNTANPEKAAPPFKIPLGQQPSLARQKQASFLERLIAIKAEKGEKDIVTVYTQRVNQGSGWRSQQKAAEATEDGEGEQETTPRRGKGATGRPRGSKRTRGPRTAKGGLFRDYRPQLWDTPGADIRAGPSSTTPESRDQLEGGVSDDRQTPIITASPLLAAQTANNANTSSLSASASASPIPPFRPPQSARGDEPGRASPALQPAIVVEENDFPVPVPVPADVEMDDV